MEPTPDAVDDYNQQITDFYNATIFPAGENVRSWFVGANTPGKSFGVALNFGGFPNYIAEVTREASDGFQSYQFASNERELTGTRS
jgi:cyclohexanone monooxygenase